MPRAPWVALLVVALAAPSPAATPGDRPASPQALAEAREYTLKLMMLTEAVSEQYVRPVSQADLIDAALTGLYEAAREPLPAGFREDLERAAKDGGLSSFVMTHRARLGLDPSVRGDRGILASLNALPRVLDAHCGVMTAQPARFFRDGGFDFGYGFDLDGAAWPWPGDSRLEGLAHEFPPPSVPFRVTAVKPGSPAQRAGFKPDDVLTHIDGEPISADTAAAVWARLLRPADDKPRGETFRVRRSGEDEPREIAVTKDHYRPETVFGVRRGPDNTWDHWLDSGRKLAYVRLGQIDQGAASSMADAVARIEQGGVRGLILDLRWCPGGYLKQSAEIAAMFLPEGPIAAMQYRNPERNGATGFRADDPGLPRFKAGDYPIVVLVNGDTSGGGELIAAALQDNKRAVVAGQRTLGKASIQTPITLPGTGGLQFKLTGGTFVRPSGKNLQRFPESRSTDDWGVRPGRGRELPMTPDLSRHLKEQTTLYALRPGDGREALDLDDPEFDSQRQAALRMLRERVK